MVSHDTEKSCKHDIDCNPWLENSEPPKPFDCYFYKFDKYVHKVLPAGKSLWILLLISAACGEIHCCSLRWLHNLCAC